MKDENCNAKNQFYVNKNDFLHLNLALVKAKKSFFNNEVPVGAVLVYKNYVVSDYNKKEKTGLPTAHAEINVINKMCRLIGDWRLDGATLYVTMIPCLMCIGAIIEARITNVVYGCSNAINDKYIYLLKERGVAVIGPIENEKCGKLLSDFFKNKRN